jgi:transposase
VIDVEDKTCPCCRGPLHLVGEDVAERLGVVPAQFRVLVTRRPRYACRACQEGVVQAPVLARLIESGLPTEALVAHVAIAKYADHCPLYRRAQIYGRQGIDLDRSTLADWVGRAAFLLRPVHARLLDKLKASSKLSPTRRPCRCSIRGAAGPRPASCGPTRGTSGRGPGPIRRAWSTSTPPTAPLPSRSSTSPASKGVLQVDGYGGYRPLAETGQVALAFCWAHVRRRFYELAAAGDAPIATEALERIKGLYAVEADIRGLTADQRVAAHQARSRPIVEELEPWLRSRLAAVSRKGKMADAIRYALARWSGLTLFLADGRIKIDSNVVERAIRVTLR